MAQRELTIEEALGAARKMRWKYVHNRFDSERDYVRGKLMGLKNLFTSVSGGIYKRGGKIYGLSIFSSSGFNYCEVFSKEFDSPSEIAEIYERISKEYHRMKEQRKSSNKNRAVNLVRKVLER